MKKVWQIILGILGVAGFVLCGYVFIPVSKESRPYNKKNRLFAFLLLIGFLLVYSAVVYCQLNFMK